MGVQMNLLTYNGLIRIDMETLSPVCDLAESYTQEPETGGKPPSRAPRCRLVQIHYSIFRLFVVIYVLV